MFKSYFKLIKMKSLALFSSPSLEIWVVFHQLKGFCGYSMRARKEKPSLQYAYPSEGIMTWFDNIAVPTTPFPLTHSSINATRSEVTLLSCLKSA